LSSICREAVVLFVIYLDIIVIGEGDSVGLVKLGLVLGSDSRINDSLGRGKGGLADELEVLLAGLGTEEVEEGLLVVEVGLGRDIVVLETLLTVEDDFLGLDGTILAVDLVTDKNDGDVVSTDTSEILVPSGDVAVGDTSSHIEHDDSSLTTDVITLTEITELFLASGIPARETEVTVVGVEIERTNVHTDGGDVTLLELTGLVTLNEGGLTDTTITNKDELEFLNRVRLEIERKWKDQVRDIQFLSVAHISRLQGYPRRCFHEGKVFQGHPFINSLYPTQYSNLMDIS